MNLHTLEILSIDRYCKLHFIFCKMTGIERIRTISLPQQVTLSIQSLLKGYNKSVLKRDVERIITKNNCINSTYLQRYGIQESMAYLVSRSPSLYGPISAIFYEMKNRLGNSFHPRNILDFGSGTGTGSWAALNTWSNDNDSIESILEIDISEGMIQVSKNLFNIMKQYCNMPLPKEHVFERFLPSFQEKLYDLVIISYVLSDMDPNDISMIKWTLSSLWQHTGKFMVLVDYGTKEGYDRIMNARQYLIYEYGAQTFAPCPHNGICPMRTSSLSSVDPNIQVFQHNNWCYFKQRVNNPAFQRQVMGYKRDWSDEYYSYVVLQKDHSHKEWKRIVGPPIKHARVVHLDVCSSGIDDNPRLERIVVPKSQGTNVYSMARKARLGDTWNISSKYVPTPLRIKLDSNK